MRRDKLEHVPEAVKRKTLKIYEKEDGEENLMIDREMYDDIARLEELCGELDITIRRNRFGGGGIEQNEGESDDEALSRWYDERNNLIVEIANLLTKTGIVSK